MLQGPGILIIDRQSAKVFVKLDVTPQAFFRLQHAGPCARVTGKVESMATLRCIVRAPSRRASAFSTLSIRLIE